MRKSKITVAVITKNEEKNIRDCINSVKGWADEIVVVDGCSDDRTISIAREMGAKVIEHKFEGDFSKERNIGMDNASGDWVLHIDADDRVSTDFKDLVDNTIDTDGEVDVYKFRRKNFFLGHHMEHGGWCHYIPNLVRRGRVRYEGALHERPVFTGKIREIEGDVEHYPFESISQFIERHNRYSTVEAERIFKSAGESEKAHLKKNIFRKSFKIFWKAYVKKRGYKEGMYGLVFAVLFAFTNFLIWSKYWELCLKTEGKTNRQF